MVSYLSEEEQYKADRLQQFYNQTKVNKITSSNSERKVFYQGKLEAINDISIMLFNIDISK